MKRIVPVVLAALLISALVFAQGQQQPQQQASVKDNRSSSRVRRSPFASLIPASLTRRLIPMSTCL